MYVIVTYDIGEKRIVKVRKILRKYITWVQNSVFEGEITQAKLEKCISEIKRVIQEDEDSIYIYKFDFKPYNMKEIIGKEKQDEEEFII